MDEKRAIDGFGAAALIGFASLLAVNQVVIKLTADGFAPVFQAGLRSVGATVVMLLWMRWRGIRLDLPAGVFWWGVLSGVIFAFEFICLFLALDLTTVSRTSIIFYSMPVWLALASHLWLPGDQLTPLRALGLILAMAGVTLALLDRGGGTASVAGDILALVAAMAWASIALVLRVTPLVRIRPEMQLLFQVAVSAIIMLALAPVFGDLVRELRWVHWAGLGFQSICVASLGFLVWFWLMTIYRAGGIASFSFLSPVLAVILGWAILDEQIGVQVWGALALVAAGIFLINRK